LILFRAIIASILNKFKFVSLIAALALLGSACVSDPETETKKDSSDSGSELADPDVDTGSETAEDTVEITEPVKEFPEDGYQLAETDLISFQ